MPEPDFNPRQAALRHAAMAEGDSAVRNHATAIVCGLIYVGDQIATLNGHLSTIVGLVDAAVTKGLTTKAQELGDAA